MFMVCSVMNNSSFDQKALTLKCDLVEIHTSEGRIDAQWSLNSAPVFLIINWCIAILGGSRVFVQRSPQYVHVGVLHGVQQSFCIFCQIFIQQLACTH